MAVVIDGTTGITAPAFDGSVDGADLTGPVSASLLTGALPALNGSALTNLPAPTSAQVGTATAGLAYGAVGTYAYGSLLATDILDGSTYAGSSIVPAGIMTPSGTQLTDASGVAAEMQGGGTALSGTWRAMGRSQRINTTLRARICLFLRIS